MKKKGLTKKTKKPGKTRKASAAPESDGSETTRQRIATLENASEAFIKELRKLPLWQQRAISI